MICEACQHDNPDSSFFCSRCGLQLNPGKLRACANCGTWNTIESRLCYQCGTELDGFDAGSLAQSAHRPVRHLLQRIFAEKQALGARGVPEGERKIVTALFSDIQGSTDLMQDLDPDEARTIVDPSLQLMIDAVEQHQGFVVASQGDGIFALFGAPVANEDHALQALRAAISMQQSIAAYGARLAAQNKPRLAIRVGLNTGEMVLRSIPRGDLQLEYNAIGHAVNLAARIQTFAPAGGIAVGEETFKLSEGYFEFRSIGRQAVKGVREPVEIRELTGVGRLHSRFELSARRGLLPLVGREEELATLRTAMGRVLSGRGQVVAVVGEPGVGKSRLFHEFKSSLGAEWRLLETSAVSHAKPFPYVPLRELLTRYFDLAPEDVDQVRREKVLKKSLSIDSRLADAVPHLCSLLGISGPDDMQLQGIGEQVRQRLMLNAIERLLAADSRKGPLAIIFEDVHWIDARSEEFLKIFAHHLAPYRILLLINRRPEYQNRWSDGADFTEISLKPLTNTATENLLSSMLGDGPNLVSVKNLIAGLTEGNPFFAEELVRDLLEKGVLRREDGGTFAVSESPGGLPAMKVPTTLQGVLASRIDALAPSNKELLQRLSIFGREFPLSLLRPFADRTAGELQRELEQLQHSGFIETLDSEAAPAFEFRHSLTQQVAYNSMTVDRRKVMHERAARAIEEVYASRLQDHYAELAYHYGRSPNLDKAVDYLGSAGNQAVMMAAVNQAIGHFKEGLNFLSSLPSSADRDAKELSIRFRLAGALWQSKGPADPEIQTQLNRVVELVKPDTDPTVSFGSLQSSVMLSWVNAEYAEALRRCDRLMSFAERMNFPIITVLSLFVRANVRMLVGELTAAQRGFEEALALYDPMQSVLPEQPTNLAIILLALYGPLLCLLGYPDRAITVCENTITMARSRSTKFHLAYVIYFAGFVRMLRGDVGGAQRLADEAISLASEFGFSNILAGARVLSGWSLAHGGAFDEGIEIIRESILRFEQTAGRIWHATLNAILLDVLMLAGKVKEAGPVVDESIQFADTFGETVTLAELWRSRGKTSLMGSDKDPARAEECFRRALSIAKQQGARLFQLRAAKDLASLLSNAGRRDEARATLAEICNWFTEGFDTNDLKDAKALLDKLA